MHRVTGILGILLIIAPFVLGYRTDSPALWSNVILGIVVLLASLWKAYRPDATYWEYWVAGIMGILAIIAPFVLGFTPVVAAMWASIILGVIVLILSAYEVYELAKHQMPQ